MTDRPRNAQAIHAFKDDESACMRLCIDFANHLDARRYDTVLDLFTDDGVLDRMGTVFSGQAAIASFLAARPTGLTTRHLCTNFQVHFDDTDEATGLCCVLFIQGTSSGAEIPKVLGAPSVVDYVDRFKRTPAGWRIRERKIRMAIQA